jgi:hypothetical protein
MSGMGEQGIISWAPLVASFDEGSRRWGWLRAKAGVGRPRGPRKDSDGFTDGGERWKGGGATNGLPNVRHICSHPRPPLQDFIARLGFHNRPSILSTSLCRLEIVDERAQMHNYSWPAALG